MGPRHALCVATTPCWDAQGYSPAVTTDRDGAVSTSAASGATLPLPPLSERVVTGFCIG
jgi:hypothetical protein